MVSFTAPPKTNLREGCELVLDSKRAAEWKIVKHDGNNAPFCLSHDQALTFATASAEAFKVQSRTDPVLFDSQLANAVLELTESQRKKLLRQGPVTKVSVEKIRKQSKGKNKDEISLDTE
jgi:hypothetical protein